MADSIAGCGTGILHVNHGLETRATKLYKRKIKLFLKDERVAVDVDVAEIIFDLVEHIALWTAQSFRYFRIDAQHRLTGSFRFSRETPGLLQNFVADCLRRFHQARSLTILTGRTQGALERLLDALTRHNH